MTQDVIPYTFIALPRAYANVFYELSEATKDLLFFLTENILGWHTDRKSFSNGFICSRTGISESSLRRARKELEDLGVLKCGITRVAGRMRVLYHLIVPPTTSPSRPERPAPVEGARPAPPRQPRRGTPSTGGTHVKNMQTTSVKEQHQAPSESEPVQKASNPIEARDLPPPPTPDDDSSRSSQKEPNLSEKQTRMVGHLESLGVHRSMSRRLVESKPMELILAALNRLPFRQAKNPAAYLVRELLDGGYGEVPAARATRDREDVQARRKAEEQEEQARREREETELKQHVDGVLARVSGEDRQKLVEEARARVGAWASRTALDEGNPVLRGALCDVILERWPMGEEARMAA